MQGCAQAPRTPWSHLCRQEVPWSAWQGQCSPQEQALEEGYLEAQPDPLPPPLPLSSYVLMLSYCGTCPIQTSIVFGTFIALSKFATCVLSPMNFVSSVYCGANAVNYVCDSPVLSVNKGLVSNAVSSCHVIYCFVVIVLSSSVASRAAGRCVRLFCDLFGFR